MEKIDRAYIRYIRYAVQLYIFLFLVYAGFKFYFFVDHFMSGTPVKEASAMHEILKGRPPSVEGFLPIGALMSLKLWVVTGVFDRIHPAGLVIFISALLMAFLLRKAFCGWICPVGAISDALWRLRLKAFKKTFTVNRWVDYSLRSIKYMLMSLFIYIILIKMNPASILGFIEGDYYKIADVKMLYFFTKMSRTTFYSLSALFLLSVLYRNFWCRYLCPYGALLGLVGSLSPCSISRDEKACIHCGKCTRNCPSLIPVESIDTVRTPECNGCLTCVSQCPSKGALDVSIPTGRRLHPAVFAFFIVVLFLGTIFIGKMTENWKSYISYEDYRRIIPLASSLDHP